MNLLSEIVSVLFLFFNFALPKAGTKIGGFPLYVSLIINFLVFFPLIFFKLFKNKKGKDERFFIYYLSAFFFICILNIIIYSRLIHLDFFSESTLSYFFGIIAAIFIFYAKYFSIDIKLFRNTLLVSFFLITIYGFIQKIFGDINTVIPGITFNFAESDRFSKNVPMNMWGKHNYIESIHRLKLSSTYQNGNLFGVNYLMLSWFSFYFLSQFKKIPGKILLIVSFLSFIAISVLTASSTVYIGLLFSFVLYYIYLIKNIIASSGKNRFFKIILLTAIPVVLILILFVFINNSKTLADLFNIKLLQRNFIKDERVINFVSYCKYLWENKFFYRFIFGSFFFTKGSMGAYEIVPAGIFVNFGILFTSVFLIFIIFFMKNLKFTIYNIGLYAYILTTFIDGGFWLPPTPFTFFTLLGYSYFILNKKEGKPAENNSIT